VVAQPAYAHLDADAAQQMYERLKEENERLQADNVKLQEKYAEVCTANVLVDLAAVSDPRSSEKRQDHFHHKPLSLANKTCLLGA
jgi:hypothetical protein